MNWFSSCFPLGPLPTADEVTTDMKRIRRGFTLFEILAVIVLIGLVVGLVVGNLDSIMGTGKVKLAKTAVTNSFAAPLMAYKSATGDYPTTQEGLAMLLQPNPKIGIMEPLLRSRDALLDPWGHPYQYKFPGVKRPYAYDLWSFGPDGKGDTEDDIGNWDAPVAAK